MKKVCIKCKNSLEISMFNKHKDTKDRLRGECKACSNINNSENRRKRMQNPENREKVRLYSQNRRIKSPDKIENSRLKSVFGISLSEYTEMSNYQNNECRICLFPETAIDRQSNKVKKLAVDHCHVTGKVRGLLCSACNTALGRFKDSIEVLQRAVDYLKESKN